MTIHFISGPARVGKSHLYRSLHKQFEGDCVELDPLLTSLINYLKPPAGHPILNPFTIEGQEFDDWIQGIIQKDEAWWPLLQGWVEEHHIYGADFLAVGIVWPHLLQTLRVPHRAVFLVDTDEAHIERAVAIARQGGTLNNWMAEWPEEKIRQWGDYNLRRARFFKDEAEKYGYPVFDVGDHGYELSQMLAAEALLGQRVS